MTTRRKLGEQVAPWALMVILATLWWGGSRFVRWSGLPDVLPSPRAVSHATAPSRSGATSSVPAPPAVADPLAAAMRTDLEDSDSPRVSSVSGMPVVTFRDITDLRNRRLMVPVQGVSPDALVSSYRDARDGTRQHEAMDIPAERGTPVLAVEDGRIAKLFDSRLGGLTIYQFDPSEQFAYYYAHLDRYEPGLTEGDFVHRGQTVGYVGTTGNARPNAPHLHFAIFKLRPERRWWEGTPLDPYIVWR
jgi:peptidoglycan LD-endopeptidase LytH